MKLYAWGSCYVLFPYLVYVLPIAMDNSEYFIMLPYLHMKICSGKDPNTNTFNMDFAMSYKMLFS